MFSGLPDGEIKRFPDAGVKAVSGGWLEAGDT